MYNFVLNVSWIISCKDAKSGKSCWKNMIEVLKHQVAALESTSLWFIRTKKSISVSITVWQIGLSFIILAPFCVRHNSCFDIIMTKHPDIIIAFTVKIYCEFFLIRLIVSCQFLD